MVDWDLENKLVEPASASWVNNPRVKMCQNVVREAQILAQRCRDVTLGREHDEGREHDAQHRACGRRLNARRQHRAGQETNECVPRMEKQASTACTACTFRRRHALRTYNPLARESPTTPTVLHSSPARLPQRLLGHHSTTSQSGMHCHVSDPSSYPPYFQLPADCTGACHKVSAPSQCAACPKLGHSLSAVQPV